MEPITVNYKVLDARAKVPAYATPGSAAADLCAVLDEPLTLAPMQRALVPTGLAIELPGAEYGAFVFARSGLAVKKGLTLSNGVGVIDSDYARSDNEGHIFMRMTNDSREGKTLIVPSGTAFAQGIFLPFGITVDDHAQGVRNGGLGSTTGH